MEFKENQWYRVRIRVTDAAIEAWIDDKQMVNQPRKDHKFDIRIECESCRPLGISTWDTTGAVRNIRVRRWNRRKKVNRRAAPRVSLHNCASTALCERGRPFR